MIVEVLASVAPASRFASPNQVLRTGTSAAIMMTAACTNRVLFQAFLWSVPVLRLLALAVSRMAQGMFHARVLGQLDGIASKWPWTI